MALSRLRTQASSVVFRAPRSSTSPRWQFSLWEPFGLWFIYRSRTITARSMGSGSSILGAAENPTRGLERTGFIGRSSKSRRNL
jgi:hypothetical protein